jgi:hypothetical protein
MMIGPLIMIGQQAGHNADWSSIAMHQKSKASENQSHRITFGFGE